MSFSINRQIHNMVFLNLDVKTKFVFFIFILFLFGVFSQVVSAEMMSPVYYCQGHEIRGCSERIFIKKITMIYL